MWIRYLVYFVYYCNLLLSRVLIKYLIVFIKKKNKGKGYLLYKMW